MLLYGLCKLHEDVVKGCTMVKGIIAPRGDGKNPIMRAFTRAPGVRRHGQPARVLTEFDELVAGTRVGRPIKKTTFPVPLLVPARPLTKRQLSKASS